ncbi:serine/threonine protein kinase, partial [bacterium]|nr:serine/threonine protein kinase [bacterium]
MLESGDWVKLSVIEPIEGLFISHQYTSIESIRLRAIMCRGGAMVGATISQYEILEELGQGGMGLVYKARDTKLRRLVALKFLPTDLTRDAKARERLMNEALVASSLDHANICTVHEINETADDQMFICMAYYPGQTLQQLIESSAAGIKSRRAIHIAKEMASGLARAHEAGIVHRDIKPSNIIITDHDEVKIIDFGIAKLKGRLDTTLTGATLGTVAYMSPEQVEGETVDHRTDIWSLAVVLVEMLTGCRLFRGEHDTAVQYSIVHEPVDHLLNKVAEIHPRLIYILRQALAKDVR